MRHAGGCSFAHALRVLLLRFIGVHRSNQYGVFHSLLSDPCTRLSNHFREIIRSDLLSERRDSLAQLLDGDGAVLGCIQRLAFLTELGFDFSFLVRGGLRWRQERTAENRATNVDR